MLWTPQKGRVKTITNAGVVGQGVPGTTVPSNATTLLDGTVTELISAANNIQDSWGINISISNTSSAGAAGQGCMDILIGGATDDVLIAALICGYQADNEGFFANYFFPLHIPQGKRIAASFASLLTSRNSGVVVTLFGGSPPPFKVGRKVTTYGTQINNARGQSITPTASGGAASVTELTSGTGADHFAFLPGFQPGGSSSVNKRFYNIGIGVGASTEDRIGTWQYGTSDRESIQGPFPALPAFYDAPAGSRLTMLAGNSGINDTSYDGLIYAVS